uniref:CHCH domain-containing protein n=1 Tax=Ananas comosus var. bracteatus TaxID=296719 RepID=A0A6V7NYP9_ANACO|nr:unnamed protein product [Ananas comosus var. bracteatus]
MVVFSSKHIEHVLLFSVGGAFGGNRGARPVPPEKGVFPLDHLHECDLEKKEYVACLKSSGFQSEKCRHFSKKYLECRMERKLDGETRHVGAWVGKEDERDPSEESNIKINNQYNPSTEKKKIAP